METLKFNAILEKFDSPLWGYHVIVPSQIVRILKQNKIKRFLCSINGEATFHAGLMPAGDNRYFININLKLRKKYGLSLGQSMDIQLAPDESRYGMPMPEELSEALRQDPEGDRYFHQLTPGKQRNLIYIINNLKSMDLRVERSIIILEHLKANQGKIDFRGLLDQFKNGL